jgi:hypothetical protein
MEVDPLHDIAATRGCQRDTDGTKHCESGD